MLIRHTARGMSYRTEIPDKHSEKQRYLQLPAGEVEVTGFPGLSQDRLGDSRARGARRGRHKGRVWLALSSRHS